MWSTNPTYREIFPRFSLAGHSAAADNFVTTARGSYLAIGVGGQLVGQGAHVLIIDDPISGQEMADSDTQREALWSWYSGVARNRVAPGGGIIVMHTRWHEDDLAGKLLAQNPDGWHVYSFPAIATEDEAGRRKGEALWPERWGLEYLESLRRDTLPRHWSALFQQNPVPDDGLHFKEDWFKWYTEPPELLRTYLAVDLAIGEKQTNDFTVIAPFGLSNDGCLYFLPTLLRARLNTFDIVENLLNLAERHKVSGICLEAGHISKTLGPHLKKRMIERRKIYSTFDMVPSRDKLARSATLQARAQMGRVYLPSTPFFKETALKELLQFPAGKHDDIVDAMAYAALFIDQYMAPGAKAVPKEEEAAPFTGEWMQKYLKQRKEMISNTRHKPPRLNGKPR
jgi:predicted phage terminase large subunit-like protein